MVSSPEGLEFKRNRMPQWPIEEGVYFVTWCLDAKGDKLSPAERTIVADAIKFFKTSAIGSQHTSSWTTTCMSYFRLCEFQP